MPNKLNYSDWKTGKIMSYLLQEEFSEKITNVYCPFDETSLINRAYSNKEVCFCPNCNAEYSVGANQDQVDLESKQKVISWLEELDILNQKKEMLEQLVQQSQKKDPAPDLFISSNSFNNFYYLITL